MNSRLLLCALFMSAPFSAQALPAFYGAEGSAALTVGGRGGAVCQVTNLNNSGAGSLRACVDMSGPRTVVFRVGGTIELTSTINVRNPYITIAGHTAPGGGIQISGKNVASCGYTFRVQTHDVIVRYLSIRRGVCDPPQPGSGTNIFMGYTTDTGSKRSERLIFDHVSLFWAGDDNFSITGAPTYPHRDTPRDITLQNSIVAETLAPHATAIKLSARHHQVGEEIVNIDMHNNLIAHNSHRIPGSGVRSLRFINNIVYHWNNFASSIGSGGMADFVGNLYKHPTSPGIFKAEIRAFLYDAETCNHISFIRLDPSIYATGNRGAVSGDDNWKMVEQSRCDHIGTIGTLPAQYRRSSPMPPAGVPITVRPWDTLESRLYPIVGDSRRLDCMGNWVFKRDSQDARIVTHAETNYDPNWQKGWTAWGVFHENEVGGFPTIAGGTPCQDTDGDGIPDEWEIANGLNPNNAADGRAIHSSGYSNLERYLNGPVQGITEEFITTPENIRFVF